MKRSIQSEFKFYNANDADKRTGDCVIRSISLALGEDYAEVRRSLNRLKNKMGRSQFNEWPVFDQYLKQQGYQFHFIKDLYGEGEMPSLEEFSKDFNVGTYLLAVSKQKQGHIRHLVCVLDGDIYDSWDSSKWFVQRYCTVKEESTGLKLFSEDEQIAITQQIENKVVPYLEKQADKYDDIVRYTYTSEYDKLEESCHAIFKIWLGSNIPQSSRYVPNQLYIFEITYKLNPNMSVEDNIKSLTVKTKQRCYDWLYNMNKEIEDSYNSEQIELSDAHRAGWIAFDPEQRKRLLKLPEWVRPHVEAIYYNDRSRSDYAWLVEVQPLEGDYWNYGYSSISFYADTLKELRDKLEDYKYQVDEANQEDY